MWNAIYGSCCEVKTSGEKNMKNPTIQFMVANGVALTRESYLQIAYMGNPPKEPLDAEIEAEIPVEILRAERRLIASKDAEFLREVGIKW
jgi:hypothetical protein